MPSAFSTGNDDRPIGLHDGLAAQTGGETGSIQRRAPRDSAVGGGAHPEETVCRLTGIVPLEVAVAKEGTVSGIVAGDPGFIGIASSTHDNGNEPVPRIGGAAHRDTSVPVAMGSEATSTLRARCRMHGRITGRDIGAAALPLGDAKEQSLSPNSRRRRLKLQSQRRMRLRETAADLECGHDGRTESKHSGLDFGGVLAVGIGEFVGAQLRKGDLPRGRRRRRRTGFGWRALSAAPTCEHAGQGGHCERIAQEHCRGASAARRHQSYLPQWNLGQSLPDSTGRGRQ